MLRILGSIFAMLLLFVGVSASAANSGITYQGRILKPDNTPLTGSNVQFRLQIRTPDANNCLMYEEVQAQNMSQSKGSFSLTINDGSGVRNDGTGLGLDRIFANLGSFSFTPSTCSSGSGTYAPNDGDGRTLLVYFKDETMAGWEPMPPQKINYVPFAFETKQVQGFTAASLLRVQESDGTLGNITPLSNANYTKLLDLIAGKLSGAAMPTTMTSGQVLGWNGTAWTSTDPVAGVQAFAKTALPVCGAGQFLKDNGSGLLTCATPSGTATGTVTSVATGAGLTGGPITTSGTIALATLNAGGTGFKVTYDTYGRVTAAVALVEADIPTLTTAGKVSGSAITSGAIGGSTSINTVGSINTAGALTSGSFSTGNITATSITAPSGSFTTVAAKNVEVYETANLYKVTLKVPTGASTSYDLTLPAAPGASGKILGTTGAGVLAWVDPSSASQWSNGAAGAINYNGGNVGVGTATPGSKLHVLGYDVGATAMTVENTETAPGASAAVQVKNNIGETTSMNMFNIGNTGTGMASERVGLVYSNGRGGLNLAASDNSGPMRFYTGGSSSTYERMRITNTGSVGIGITAPLQKLDVAGAIRIGTTATCDGTLTGTIRYNGGNLEFCNGAWQTLGVSGAGITSLTGDVTSTGAPTATTTIAANAITTAKILDGAVTSSKIAPFSIDSSKVGGNALSFDRLQQINSGRLVGRGSAGVGTIQEITLGTNLVLTTAGVLNATDTDSFAALPCADGYIPQKVSGAWSCVLPTAAGTNDAIVKRDSAGSFVAAGATFTGSMKLKDGAAGGEVTLAAPTGFTSYGLTLPTTAGSSGFALVTNGSGVLSWANPASSGPWTVAGSDVYRAAGSVGIGTSTPTATLDVVGAINSSGQMSAGSTGTNGSFNVRSNAGSLAGYFLGINTELQIGAVGTSKPITFYASDASTAAERMRVSGTGVGIGVTAPTAALHLPAGTSAAGSAPLKLTSGTLMTTPENGAIEYNGLGFFVTRAGARYPLAVQNDSNYFSYGTAANPSIGFTSDTDTGLYRPAANTVGVAAGGVTSAQFTATTNSVNYVTVQGSVAGAAPVIGVDGSDTNINLNLSPKGTGNVIVPSSRLGIGTASPSQKLDVVGNFRVGSAASGGKAYRFRTDGGALDLEASNNDLIMSNWSAADFTGTQQNFLVLKSGSQDAQALGTWTWYSGNTYGAGTAQVAIKGNGTVGIGTTTLGLGEKLNVTGGAITAGPQGTGVNSGGEIRLKELAAGGANYVGFRSPDGLTTDTVWTLPTGLGTNGQVLTTDASGVLSWTTPAGGASQWATSGANISYVAGNVGIGTTSPQNAVHAVTTSSGALTYPLRLQNADNATGTSTGILFNTDSVTTVAKGALIYQRDGSGWGRGAFQILQNTAADTSAPTAANAVLTVLNNGNVGIGNTSPSSILHIEKSQAAGTEIQISNFSSDAAAAAGLVINSDSSFSAMRAFSSGAGSTFQFETTAPALNLKTGNAAGIIRFITGGSTERVRVDKDGNMGIGTTTTAEKLSVNGNVLATAYLYSSDRRLKKDITQIEGSLAKVLRLNGVTYRWITPLNEDANREQMGVIAQDVEAVFPQAVTVSKDGIKRVNYPMLVAPVIEAVKELNSKSEQQARSIASLEARALSAEQQVRELKQKNAEFEARFRALEKSLRPAN